MVQYAPARALAREAFNSDDRELIALSLPLIPATHENKAEALNRMLAVAQYPECEAAVLNRLVEIYGQKGFPGASLTRESSASLLRHVSEEAFSTGKMPKH